ncbi:unnamed protein product [Anisakis simplex]|uniref:NTP_transferase domain-containing protein n=1 Tax=Anisakis simplex TaxID=6269 RepID=A0A0M3KH18_ANISI|nr:unnamed protein product [Anisakis simplex]
MVRNDATTGGASSGQKADDTAPLTAILVADSFDRRFAPIVDETSSLSCVRLANVKVLDYTLEWLSRTEIRDVIVVVASSHEAALSELLSQWTGSFESLKLVTCQNCMSVGDAIREVETRSMITSDFLLITNPATFCNSNLVQQIRAYRFVEY